MLDLAGLHNSPLAVWLLDAERMRIAWANREAVALWRADSEEDLLGRDLSGAPMSVITRTTALLERVRDGQVVIEDWTLYPKGVPTTVKLHLTAARLADGRVGILNQALLRETAPDPSHLRGIETLRHVPLIVALVSEDDIFLMQNPAAIRAFGDQMTWSEWFADPAIATALRTSALEGQPAHRRLTFETLNGERLHSVHAHPAKDPVTGEPAVLIHHTDETDRAIAHEKVEEQRALNERLQETLALIEKQRNDILSLSAPILDVGEATIAMPIIGDIDEARSQEIVERLLPVITSRRAAHVILDMTSAIVSDEAGATRLMQMLGAVRLLGAHPMITGIQPKLATQLVAAGFANSEVSIARDLAQGLSRNRRRA